MTIKAMMNGGIDVDEDSGQWYKMTNDCSGDRVKVVVW